MPPEYVELLVLPTVIEPLCEEWTAVLAAVAIADAVLQIGYLQWHLRLSGDANRLRTPILSDFGNIRCRDAVLTRGTSRQRMDHDG